MLLSMVVIAALLVPLHHAKKNGSQSGWWKKTEPSGYQLQEKLLLNWEKERIINVRKYLPD